MCAPLNRQADILVVGHGGHSSAPASGAVASTSGGIKCVGVEDATGDIDPFADLYCYLQEHELMRWRNILVEEGITFDRLQYLVLQEGALKEIGIGPTAVRFKRLLAVYMYLIAPSLVCSATR